MHHTIYLGMSFFIGDTLGFGSIQRRNGLIDFSCERILVVWIWTHQLVYFD